LHRGRIVAGTKLANQLQRERTGSSNIFLANSVAVDCGPIEGRLWCLCKQISRKDATTRSRNGNEFDAWRMPDASEDNVHRV
jgi:hypothetical protein